MSNIRISSVGPGYVTGSDVVHELTGMDLAMKLHYLTQVYIFRSQAVQGLNITRLKEGLFYLFNDYYMVVGRLRRSESDRPYIKCNDCGARFVEADCEKTVDEWLECRDYSVDQTKERLVYHQPIGPELSFSPMLYFQVTWFKCGGMALGVSWAHLLGDAFSFADLMNKWGQISASLQSNASPSLQKSLSLQKSETLLPVPVTKPKDPFSIKRVDPVGDHWVTVNQCKMDTFSFRITSTQISSYLKSKLPLFESLCAIIWQCVAIARDGEGPNVVTICRKDTYTGSLSNNQMISSVWSNFSVVDADFEKLAKLLLHEAVDEKAQIEQAMESSNGVSDFIVYGANLTFVNLQDADLYGLEFNGCKPELVCSSVEGVGDEGAVLVLPGSKDYEDNGRFVTLILPQEQLCKVKPELIKKGLLLETIL